MFSQALEICAQCDTYGCVVVANALTAVFVGSRSAASTLRSSTF